MWQQWFGAVWQENTQLIFLAADPARLHAVYPEFVMPDSQWKAFADTRTGMIVGRQPRRTSTAGRSATRSRSLRTSSRRRTAARPGPSISSASTTARTRSGSAAPTSAGSTTPISTRQTSSARDVRAPSRSSSTDPDRAAEVASTIDRMFENSSDETKTQTEKDFNLGFFKQIGDIGLIVRWILFAVFFTLLLVVGNTIAQSVRERIPELAILKTLGFSNGSVLGLRARRGGGALHHRRADRARDCDALIGIAIGRRQFPDRRGRPGLARRARSRSSVLSLAVGLLPALRASRVTHRRRAGRALGERRM